MQKVILKKIEKNYKDQKNKIIKDTLKKHYNIDNYEICYTENGKPYIKDNSVYFSISNKNDLFIIVFDNKPVGVDIEYIKEVPNSFKKFLQIENLDNEEAIIEFSKREAIIKLEDKTLQNINDFNVKNYNIKSLKKNNYIINIAKHK